MRLLIVEDESLIAILIEESLAQFGCAIVGPAVRLAQAMELARSAEIDGAILDINVHGEAVYPVAAILAERGIPFVFVSGYDVGEIDPRFRDRPLLRKPFTSDDLGKAIERMRKQPAAAR
jgi:two-component SAPR family response regulator